MTWPPRQDDPAGGGQMPRLPPYLRPGAVTGAHPVVPGPAPPAAEPPGPGAPGASPPEAVTPAGTGTPGASPRPFVVTRGRVADDASGIRMETQVTANPDALDARGRPAAALPAELRAIVAACREPLSVAEISARLRLHLGVTRVLVSDLRAGGHLVVHTQDAPNPRSADLILRVINGLRTIS